MHSPPPHYSGLGETAGREFSGGVWRRGTCGALVLHEEVRRGRVIQIRGVGARPIRGRHLHGCCGKREPSCDLTGSTLGLFSKLASGHCTDHMIRLSTSLFFAFQQAEKQGLVQQPDFQTGCKKARVNRNRSNGTTEPLNHHESPSQHLLRDCCRHVFARLKMSQELGTGMQYGECTLHCGAMHRRSDVQSRKTLTVDAEAVGCGPRSSDQECASRFFHVQSGLINPNPNEPPF
jgi:hypothetical protein